MCAAQAKGLGKGLSALMSEEYSATAKPGTAPANNVNGVSELALDKVLPGSFQPRSYFDDEQLRELADSIRANGLMQPIVVRPTKKAGQYEIIAGERRWRAARLAGLTTITALVRDIGDRQALELAIVENVQRQDLSPLEEAGGYQRLMQEFEYTQEQLSETVGKSRSHIANLMRLMTLPEEIKTLLEQGKLSMGHARALLGAADPIAIARAVVERGLSVRQAEALARGEGQPPRPRRNSTPRKNSAGGAKDADILALEETLSESLGLRVSINDQGQSGEIILAYDSLAQLDDILQRLGGPV